MGKNPGPFLHVEVPNIMFRLMVPKNANMINKTFKTILDIITNHYGSLKKAKTSQQFRYNYNGQKNHLRTFSTLLKCRISCSTALI